MLSCSVFPARAPLRPGRQRLISHGGYAVTANGVILRSYNRDIAFAPASTIKLVTCLAALKTLGADYRFTTTFYLDSNDILYIQGSGDPSLTSGDRRRHRRRTGASGAESRSGVWSSTPRPSRSTDRPTAPRIQSIPMMW